MGLSKEDKDCWRTPPYMFNALNKQFNFGLDVCASDANHLCPNYLTNQNDALLADWREHIEPGKRWAFCNPPYSNAGVWTVKAREMQKVGIGTVMLVNNSTDTEWYHDSKATLCIQLRGRIKFLHPITLREGKSPSKGNAILIYNPYWPENWQKQIVEASVDFYKELAVRK